MKKMKRGDIEDYAKQSGENLILIDGYDDAIIGICQKFNSVSVLYDKDKIIKKLAKHMDYDDALEYLPQQPEMDLDSRERLISDLCHKTGLLKTGGVDNHSETLYKRNLKRR